MSKKSKEPAIAAEGPRKRHFHLTEAENGFEVEHSGGELGYEGKKFVFGSAKEAADHLSQHLSPAEKKASKNPLAERKAAQRAEAQAAVEGSMKK